ncbi:MAG: ribonuclease H-like domain-containing protein [Eubacteriales bacterium]|nr:ribonuclease H-like domain-containing protein [Eubacteriales bacterium]
MIKQTTKISLHLENTPFGSIEKSRLLFFDIETTGFTARSSSLYLIGCVAFLDGEWQAIQWFAENPAEESEILSLFLDFSRNFSQLIHFNGDRFDLPFLQEKCRAYGLTDTLSPLLSRDLYTMIRPLKKLLGLSALNQKSLEQFMGLFRRDPYSGGELIQVYQEYVHSALSGDLNMLLLHNYEDLCGMLSILPMLSYLCITSGTYRITESEVQEDTLILYARLPQSLPRPFSCRQDHFYLTGSQQRLAIQINGTRQPLKHFFDDYKNYYYLPQEDTAIHKSVAAYVDKAYREPAKASTCYSKKKGFYLPQFHPVFTPVFKENYKDTLTYFACTDAFLQDKEKMTDYIRHLIHSIL